jgi:uncharacterized protein
MIFTSVLLITIITTAIIQSIFGVGVLLFGTPILLIFGYDYHNALVILLPISLSINIFQLYNHYKEIDFDFFKKILLFTIPLVVLFLYVTFYIDLVINHIVGGILIIFAIKKYFKYLDNIFQEMIKHDKILFLFMGAIHGLSNLGGSLLVAGVFNKNLSKIQTRSTIAVSYLTFAMFQLITLIFIINNENVNFLQYYYLWFIGAGIFIIVEKLFFVKIKENQYSKLFEIFLFTLGTILLLKN